MRSVLLCLAILFAATLSAKNIAIIGGGMAGVAAAAFLRDSGHQVHLFESRSSLGGNAQTVSVRNANDVIVPVDIGPQYFAKGAWDLYIDFLSYFKLYNPSDFIEFDTSIVIAKKDAHWPNLATPRCLLSHVAVNFCRQNSSRLMALKALMDVSVELYKTSDPDFSLNVEDWLKKSRFDDEQNELVYLPFLASILGTTIEQTKSLSALSLAHLYAFRAPTLCAGTKFSISKQGMGELIGRVGNLLKRTKRVHIHTQSPVTGITRLQNVYEIDANGEKKVFDAIIVATHPQDLALMINSANFMAHLRSLPYISARLVLHRDHGADFLNPAYPAHFNVIIDPQGEVMTTMNLEEIDPRRYRGILKSWVNSDEVYAKMQDVLTKVDFKHPLMTPRFLNTVELIKQNIKKDAYALGPDFAIAGGWTQLHETQSTAIMSAFEAVSSLGLMSEDEMRTWKNRLRLK